MTIEEAIRMLKYNSNVIHKTINGETDTDEVEALDMAIQSLEAWEKVKNDICEIDWYGDDAFWDGVNLVSDIIDKHLSEVSG